MKTFDDFVKETEVVWKESLCNTLAWYSLAAKEYGIYMQEQGYEIGFTHGQQATAHEILDKPRRYFL